jgi:hypothetical protein
MRNMGGVDIDDELPTFHEGLGSLAMLMLVVLGTAAVTALLVAGILLDHGGVAALAVSDGCSGASAGGFAVLALAGAAVGLMRVVAERRTPHVLLVDPQRGAGMALVPLLGAIAALPGAIGCRGAEALSGAGSFGEALLGAPGATLAGACAFGCGMAVMSAVRILPPAELVAAAYEADRAAAAAPVDPVTAALERHDLLD